jgi:hypothetical protein
MIKGVVKVERFTSDHRRRKVPKVGLANPYLPRKCCPGQLYTRPIGSKSCPDLGPVGPIGSAAYASDSATLVAFANVHGNNRDDQKVNFGLQNALNLAYVHLQFRKFSRSNIPGPLKGEGRGRVRKWKGGKDRGMGAGEEGTGRKGREVPLLKSLVWVCHNKGPP